VVLATGGRRCRRAAATGSATQLAAGFGHWLRADDPALAPLVLRGDAHALAGSSHPAALTLRAAGKTRVRLEGALLWTHFGVSGPVVLNLSRHWHRAARRRATRCGLSVLPGRPSSRWSGGCSTRPRAAARAGGHRAGRRLPQAVAGAWLAGAGSTASRRWRT
jgi:predicted flavoprotein YhiN